MMKDAVIGAATTIWASLIMFEPKKDGSLRYLVDYLKVNAITVRSFYPLPKMVECVDYLGDARIFSKLDANSGYWIHKIYEKGREKTTFTSPHGLSV